MAFNLYMHERNIYRNQPDFGQIALDNPAFRQYAIPDAKGKKFSVDFSNPDALRMVTEILLKKDFNLDVKIPEGFLIPTVPQRLNYILWLEDLLEGIPQKGKSIKGIDIGTGPCAIFSILGAQKNNWNFIATEASADAIHWAKKNIEKNNLEDRIRVVQVSPGTTLNEILSSNEETYDFCLCNPPFFENIEEIRKKHHNSKETIADVAQKEEIFFSGGELSFVKNILNDSLIYKNRVCLFTSMFGKKKNFLEILKEIEDLKEAKVTTTEFCQGNTIRWGIAWTFNKNIQFEKADRKVKPKKAKPPLEYQIPLINSKAFNLHILMQQTKSFVESLLIPVTVTRSTQYFAELLLKSDKNTWTHQRRKRREIARQKKEANCSDFGAISGQNICTSVDTNESKISEDISVSSVGNISVDTEELSEQCNSNTEATKPNNKRKDFCLDDSSINKKPKLDVSLSDENCSKKSESESKALLEESLPVERKNSVSFKEGNNELLSSKNDAKSITFEDDKCERKDEVSSKYKSNSSHDSEKVSDTEMLQNMQEDNNVANPSEFMKNEFHADEKSQSASAQQGSVLHCHLQLIKGKNKIYVKMNCPPSADRSTMYQVFQLIKNKIK